MQTQPMEFGSYGINDRVAMSRYEDESVGSGPQALSGIVAVRIEDGRVFVRDWQISAHFHGEQSLEKFEEAKHHQDFDFTFSEERELRPEENLDGEDPVLKDQLRRHLKSVHAV